ncbi:Defensin propeptide containing protein [Cricetulus griseus]|uniref:Defensin propeptide containing protein n=1 Tax=Cricetulus griseus TaxID=10029 RepID=A0A061IHH3_CRIGR|nr:Defensin propeptide containing protein [Cricetulus griseus]
MKRLVILSALVLLAFKALADPLPEATEEQPGVEDQDVSISFGSPEGSILQSQAINTALNFERPCYLRGGICLKQGTPNCEPFRGPCRAFMVCCKIEVDIRGLRNRMKYPSMAPVV